jgi:general L-amino acid transport system substrate-binding protein
MTLRAALAALLLALAAPALAQAPAPQAAPHGASPIFDAVRARDHIRCGVSQGTPGFAVPDSQGVWRGFDVAFCRALAAAVPGDANKLRDQPCAAQQRLGALRSGEIDVLLRNTPFTFQRDIRLGLESALMLSHDGAGFLARRQHGLATMRGLDGATACVQTGATNQRTVADFARANSIRFTPLVRRNPEEVPQTLFAGRRDAMNGDRAALASARMRAPSPDQLILLPEVLSKEPCSPVVAQGDQRWPEIVRWVAFGLIEAEENVVTAANVDQMMSGTDPTVQRLLGVSGGFGQMPGLDDRSMASAIGASGNWAESFARNLAPLGIDRGVNHLWSRGGALDAPAFR